MRHALALLLLVTGAVAAAAAPVAPLAISSPADVSDLVPVVEVRGTAAEPGGSIAWSVTGTDRAGQEPVAADGSFAFSISADGLHLTQIVRIVARGSQGAYAERVLLLVDRDPGPVLSLAPPADGELDAHGISFSGSVANPASGPIGGWLEALSWSIPALGRGGALVVDGTGAFATTIDVPSRAGPVTLWLRAEDQFGHLTLHAIRSGVPRAAAPTTAAEPAAETPPPAAATGRIEITTPEGTGWYRLRLAVEGRVVGVSPLPETLAWSVSGDEAPAGEILVDSDGTFRLEIATGALTGDRMLSLTGVDGALGAEVVLRDARRAPEVGITAPGSGGQYASQLWLAGTVTDPYAGDPLMGGLASVSWQMSPLGAASSEPARSGTIEVAADGTFSAILPTAGVTGQQVVSVVAVGRSGNTGRAAIRVTRGESDVSSFSAVAGDGIVTLRWDTETGAAGYDLRFAVDRPIGDDATTVADVKPPYVLRGLANGSRCVLRLRVRRPGEPDTWSADREALPLSPDTLKPDVVGEYGGVRLSWRPIPGAASFEVQRSARPDAGWEVLASGLAPAGWLDESASAGLTWYYRVRPEVAGAIASGAGSGTAQAFAARALESAGTIALPGARAVEVSGDYAWVCGDDGVHVVDLADPGAPREVARMGMGDALAIDVAGALAAVVDRERGLVMLDVAEPRAPREIGVRFVPDARAVALLSDIAYVACGPNGVRLLDVSDPRSPERLGTIASPDARALCRHEGRLLVADAQVGLRVFDLTEPAAPRPVADVAIAGARAVSASGARAIVVGAQGVSIVDLGDPARPALLAIVAPEATCAAVSADGNAIVAGAGGLAVLDAADPAGRPIDTIAVPGAEALVLAGEIACLLADDALWCLRVHVLGRPAVVGQAAVPVSAGRIASTGGRVFVAARSSGMYVFDVIADGERRELRPALVVEARFAEDAAFGGGFAFVADGAAGLRIFALEGAAAGAGIAREVARFQPAAAVHGVSVSGSIAVVAAGAAGVMVLDVVDPAVPRQLAAIASPDARDVAFEGAFLLVADASAGLRSFDLAVPSRPVENAPALPPAVRVSSGKGWAIAVGPRGVTIVDWGSDGIPRVAGFHPTAWAEDAVRVGDRLIVAEGHQGLVVLDLADPARPRAIAALRDVHASAVAAVDGYVLAAGAGSVAALKVLVPPWLESR